MRSCPSPRSYIARVCQLRSRSGGAENAPGYHSFVLGAMSGHSYGKACFLRATTFGG